jgi:hypothetical protein
LQVSLVYGRLAKSKTLRLRSPMPGNGVIFSDGIEADRLDFNSGTEADHGYRSPRAADRVTGSCSRGRK